MSDYFENNTNNFDSDEQNTENDVFSSQAESASYDDDAQTDAPESVAAEAEDAADEPSGDFQPQQPQYTGTGTSSEPYSSNQSNSGYYGYSQPQNSYNGYNQQPQQSPNAYYQFGRQQNPQYNYSRPTPPPVKKSSKGKKAAAAVIVLAVIVGIFAVVTSLFNTPTTSNPNTTVQPPVTSAAENGEQTTATSAETVPYSENKSGVAQLSAVEVAEKSRKSVVGVMTYKGGQLSGEGSGVVMGMDSSKKYTYIITCAHVINEKGATYGILTLEGKRYDATLVAADERTDIGVVRVEANDLPIAEFGDSTSLKVGETVYAIGNPGGSEYFGSMTDGIISAIDRSINNTYNMTCIQHNAAINPGNSGGALVNSAGQVIGINSSKIAATDYEGMGFAIPMSIVKPIVDNLIQYGYVPNRPKLGIQYASVNDYRLYSMVVAIKGLPAGSLVIAGISNDSSIVNTDAQVGDLIIGVNGKPMDSSDTLLDLINTGNVGDSITLNLCRVESNTYKITKFDVTIKLVEDRGTTEEEVTTTPASGYNYGGASSFEDFFEDYFGFGR